jgi:hypothetical protein
VRAEAIFHRLSMRDQLAVLPQVLYPLSGYRDESSASWLMVMLDEASFVGVFPYGRRGQDVRQASIISAYGRGLGPIHSSRLRINASTGFDTATSLRSEQ